MVLHRLCGNWSRLHGLDGLEDRVLQQNADRILQRFQVAVIHVGHHVGHGFGQVVSRRGYSANTQKEIKDYKQKRLVEPR